MTTESLKDGTTVTLRALTWSDLERSFEFFRALPADDRRYLRVDVTKMDNVAKRIRRAEDGSVHRVIALVGDRVVADGALEMPDAGWRRHLGEIRVIVAPEYRVKGLGAVMIQHLFRDAVEQGVEKIVVKTAGPQNATRKICERLGFRIDAVLPGYLKDMDGHDQDLVVMSCTVDEVWRELHDYYDAEDWPDG